MQRTQVSQQPSYPQGVSAGASATDVAASPGDLDPSFRAIQNLNRPKPVIVPAMITVPNDKTITDKIEDNSSAPTANQTRQRLASSDHDSHSFSARVDRLMQAVEQGQHTRFDSPDPSGRVQVFASSAGTSSEIGSEGSITRQIAAYPESFGRILGPDVRSIRSPSSIVSDIDSPKPSEVKHTRPRAGTPVISEDQRQALQQRIRDRIAESAQENALAAIETVIRHERHTRGVDPRVLYTIGRNGLECQTISPIPLDYRRSLRLRTPSVSSSGDRSALPSPLNYVATRNFAKADHPAFSKGSIQSTRTTAKEEPGLHEVSPSGAGTTSSESEENEQDRHEKTQRIISWLRRVKSALKPSENSPARKLGRAIGVFHDKSPKTPSNKSTMPGSRPNRSLQDVTNVRRSGYLERNSFAQERKIREKIKAKFNHRTRTKSHTDIESARKEAMAKARMALKGHAVADSPQATKESSRRSSKASTAKPTLRVDEEDPVAFALARLEGREPPPALSPFQVRRSRDDIDSYGPHVEVELGRLRLESPQPLIPVRSGEWNSPLERAVEEGFDCAIAAPEEDWEH
ncbi:MAG: hypothetical protein Q9201_004941 [Fulgogasparrea decipioides]